MIQLSIILPTYNERESLPKAIDIISKNLYEYKNQFEIIVVDDDSPDKTYQLVKSISEEKPWVHLIHRVQEKGLSSAIVSGFSSANGGFLVVMDADMQHDAAILPDFLKAFKESNDIVIGSRRVEGGGIENWSFHRRFTSWVAALLAKLILPVKVKDPMSGYFGLRKEVFETIIPSINPRGFKILLEFLAHSKEYKIKEIGYVFRDRQYGRSKFSTKTVLDYLLAIYELSMGKIIPIRFVRYVLAGLVGILVYQIALCLR